MKNVRNLKKEQLRIKRKGLCAELQIFINLILKQLATFLISLRINNKKSFHQERLLWEKEKKFYLLKMILM